MSGVDASAYLAPMEAHPPIEATELESAEPKLAPLVLATMASQALLVTLSPTTVAVGRDLGASVGAVGQARSVAASVAIVASLAILRRIDALGVPRLLGVGAALAIVACAAVSLAPTLALFLAAHVLVGLAFACLLSAGFAGVATFPPARRPWAVGYVAGANAVAWIVVLPVVGSVTEWLSWRVAEVVPAAIAVAALLPAPAAAFAPNQPAAPELSTLLRARSARRWLGAEVIAYGAWTALLTFVGAFFIERLGVPEAAAGWLLAMGAAAHLTASTRSRMLVNLVPRRHLAAGSAVIMAILLFVLLEAHEIGTARRRHLLPGRLRRRGPVADVERPRPRAAAPPPGRDDGGADGRDSTRLPAGRRRRRGGHLARRLRHARHRARDRHGRVGCTDPPCRRPAGGTPAQGHGKPALLAHAATKLPGPRLGRTPMRVSAPASRRTCCSPPARLSAASARRTS